MNIYTIEANIGIETTDIPKATIFCDYVTIFFLDRGLE
tara:strand:- start:1150 stop:1263 length:114 start_codon:yes stop_codon:yes gene_type:complete